MRLKGHVRTQSKAVVSTDHTEYEIIKRERARKKATDSIEKQMDQLRQLVLSLKGEVEELKRNG